VFVVLVLTALVLMAVITAPFASALFVAAVFAAALNPWCERLSARLRGRRGLAAGILTAAVVLLIIAPLVSSAVVIAGEVAGGVTYVRDTLKSEGVEGFVNDLPAPAQRAARAVLARIPEETLDPSQISWVKSGQAAASRVGGVLSATGDILIQTVFMLIGFYFLLIDGERLVAWVDESVPLPPGQTLELLGEFRNVSGAVLISSVLTSGIQALMAMVGYLIAKAPHPLFFTLLTFVIAFVPAAGAGLVVLFVAALVYFSGREGAAIFLVLWGVLAVGLADNILKPILMKGRVPIHGAVIFFALLGGLQAFGIVGLVAGPLIVAFFLAVVRIAHRDYATPTPDRAQPPPSLT